MTRVVARFFRSNAVLMALMLWIGACASERSVQQTSEPAVLPELVPGARFGCVECEGLLERWLLEGEAIEPEIVIAPQDLPADPSDATRSRVTALAFRSDGGFVLGDRWSYRLYAYDAAGEPIGEFGREIPRQSKSQQQREREREKVDRSGGRLTLQPDMNHFQQWSLKFDCQGRLWVLTTRGGPDRSAIDLFDADRRYLGEIQVAQHIVQGGPMFELAGGRLAAVVEDDDGIQTVQVWRVKG